MIEQKLIDAGITNIAGVDEAGREGHRLWQERDPASRSGRDDAGLDGSGA